MPFTNSKAVWFSYTINSCLINWIQSPVPAMNKQQSTQKAELRDWEVRCQRSLFTLLQHMKIWLQWLYSHQVSVIKSLPSSRCYQVVAIKSLRSICVYDYWLKQPLIFYEIFTLPTMPTPTSAAWIILTSLPPSPAHKLIVVAMLSDIMNVFGLATTEDSKAKQWAEKIIH